MHLKLIICIYYTRTQKNPSAKSSVIKTALDGNRDPHSNRNALTPFNTWLIHKNAFTSLFFQLLTVLDLIVSVRMFSNYLFNR